MNLYYLFYYRIYKATYKSNKDVVEWTSMVALSVLVFFNVVTLFAFIYSYIPKAIVKKGIFVMGMLLILGINYFIFIFKRKYEKIIDNYSIKKGVNNFFTGILTLIYIIGSILLMFYVLKRMPLL